MTATKLPRRISGRRWLILAGVMLLAIAAVVYAGQAGAPSGPGVSTPASGMNGWALQTLAPPQLAVQLAAMQDRGVKLLRTDASWRSIEPSAPGPSGPVYSFARQDAVVAALAAHHISWLPVIDYSAPWAASRPGDWRSPPAHDAQFAAFAAAVARRYGAGGRFWALNPRLPYLPVRLYEVWNEENGAYFWDTGPNPAAYAELYLATRAAIHGVQPEAQVVIGGLTNPEPGIGANQYITYMFQQVPTLRGRVDGVALHPYAATAPGVVQAVQGFRAALDALGAGAVPIEVTELGWPAGDAATEQRRARMLHDVAVALGRSDCGIDLLAPYDWENPAGTAAGGDWGLAAAGGLRPAGAAWFAGLRSAVGGRSPARLCTPPTQTHQS